jgi:uncharacterized phage-like protein YoqJ
MIVAFTGHRPQKLGGFKLPNLIYINVCQQIDKVLKELKPEKVISGMALGVDQWAASISYKLGIPFIAAVPFIGQESVWATESKKIYNKLLAKAVEKVIVSDGEYSAQKLQIRNEWLCNHSDILLAIFDGSPGGTANCIKYAKSINMKIIIINPNI